MIQNPSSWSLQFNEYSKLSSFLLLLFLSLILIWQCDSDFAVSGAHVHMSLGLLFLSMVGRSDTSTMLVTMLLWFNTARFGEFLRQSGSEYIKWKGCDSLENVSPVSLFSKLFALFSLLEINVIHRCIMFSFGFFILASSSPPFSQALLLLMVAFDAGVGANALRSVGTSRNIGAGPPFLLRDIFFHDEAYLDSCHSLPMCMNEDRTSAWDVWFWPNCDMAMGAWKSDGGIGMVLVRLSVVLLRQMLKLHFAVFIRFGFEEPTRPAVCFFA